MKLRFLKSKKKGITPIIAIVLLLMMTVAAGGMAWRFIQTTMEKQQSAAEKELGKMNQAQLKVLEGNGSIGASPIALFIKNPGVAMSLSTSDAIVKIDGRVNTAITLGGTCTTAQIDSGSTCYLDVTGVNLPDLGDTVDIEILFKTGQTVVYSCTTSYNGLAGQDRC